MKRLSFCFFVLFASAVFLAVSAGPACAVDGVVLINQATATNGGLAGCPTSGTTNLIIICHSGSYRLSGNLIVPTNKVGINVTLDNVSIDLNGFSITCPNAVCPAGICTTTASNVKVSNGTVRGFGSGSSSPCIGGVSLLAGNEVVDKVQAENNEVGIYLVSGAVTNSIVNQNKFGIRVGFPVPGGDAFVSGNSVQNNGAAGILVGGRASITNNLITGNANDPTTGNFGGLATDSFNAFIGYGSNTFAGNRFNLGCMDLNGCGTMTSMNNNACTTGPC